MRQVKQFEVCMRHKYKNWLPPAQELRFFFPDNK